MICIFKNERQTIAKKIENECVLCYVIDSYSGMLFIYNLFRNFCLKFFSHHDFVSGVGTVGIGLCYDCSLAERTRYSYRLY